MLSDEIDATIVRAHHLQIDREQFLDLARKRLEVFQKKSKSSNEQ